MAILIITRPCLLEKARDMQKQVLDAGGSIQAALEIVERMLFIGALQLYVRYSKLASRTSGVTFAEDRVRNFLPR